MAQRLARARAVAAEEATAREDAPPSPETVPGAASGERVRRIVGEPDEPVAVVGPEDRGEARPDPNLAARAGLLDGVGARGVPRAPPELAAPPPPLPLTRPLHAAPPGPAREMSEVRAQAVRAADAIPRPSGFTAAQQAVRERGFRIVTASRPAGTAPAERARGGRAAARVGEPERPREPDPVPQATKVMRKALDRKLDPFALPEFERSPRGRLPRLGKRPVSDIDLQAIKAGQTDKVNAEQSADDQKLLEEDRKRLERERTYLLTGQDPAEAKPDEKGAAKRKTASREVEDRLPEYDEPPPPPPIVFEPARKEDLARLFAGLLAESRNEAKDILHRIRLTVVSRVPIGFELDQLYPDLGEIEHLRQVEQALKDQIDELRKGAEITEEEVRKRVAERVEELEALRAASVASATDEELDAARDARRKARDALAAAEAKKEAADRAHQRAKRRAPEVKLKMDPPWRAWRQLEATRKDVADALVRYRQRGEIRAVTLARIVHDYGEAYKFAWQQDDLELHASTADHTSAAYGEARETARLWLERVTKWLEAWRAARQKETDANVRRLQDEARAAGDVRLEAVRVWLEKKTGKKRTAEEKLREQGMDRMLRRKTESDAFLALERSRQANGVSGDFALVAKLAAEVKAGKSREAIIAAHSLNLVQREILDAYLNPPVRGDDRALSGVMAGVRARLALRQQGEIAPKMEGYLLYRHSDDLVGLDRLGGIQTPGFVATDIAKRVRSAVDRVNTDEDAVYAALDALTKIQAQAIRLAYRQEYGTSIESDLKGGWVKGMSGAELERAYLLLETKQDEADAVGARIAMVGNEGAWYHIGGGSASSTGLDEVFHGKSAERRKAAERAYNARYDDELKAKLPKVPEDASADEKRRIETERAQLFDEYERAGKSQLLADAKSKIQSERQRERFQHTLRGDDDAADAFALRDLIPTEEDIEQQERQRRSQGLPPSYAPTAMLTLADHKKVEAIYIRVRREATEKGDRLRWTSDEIEAEIARRTANIERIFGKRFAKDYDAGTRSPLRAAFDWGFRHSDPRRKLAHALADNDTARADAARVQIEHTSLWASDSVENAILQSQYQRALAMVARDQSPVRRMLMARKLADLEKREREKAREEARARGADVKAAEAAAARAWDGKKEWAAQQRLQREMNRSLEKAAREQAAGNMTALRDAYRTDYDGNLDAVIEDDTSGYSGRKAETLLKNNGYLTLGETLYFVARGAGTEQEARDALKGRTEAEIKEARGEFKRLARDDAETDLGKATRFIRGPDADLADMDSELKRDLGARGQFDIGQLLKGDPETIDEKRQRFVEAIAFENQVGTLGRYLGSRQRDALDKQLERLDATIARLQDPTLTARQRQMYLGFFEQDAKTIEAGIEAHREELDSWTDTITTVVGIVVGVLVSIVTFGAAGLVLAAVLGSIAATASTMIIKELILGSHYGRNEIMTDLIVGVVDAITAAVTAGMGEKLLGTLRRAAAPRASRLAFGRMVQRSLGSGGRLAFINPAESALVRAIPTSSTLRAMVERGGLSKLFAVALAEGAEQFVANTPSALAATLLDKNTWESGNPVGNIVSGTLRQSVTSAGMGLGMKAGFHATNRVRAISGLLLDAMKAPRAPELESFARAQRAFPGLTYDEFTQLRAAAQLELELRARAGAEAEAPRARPDDVGPEGTAGAFAGERRMLPDEGVAHEARERPVAESDAREQLEATGRPDIRERPLTNADVRDHLPAELRDLVPTRVDDRLPGRTVQVELQRKWGIVTEVRLVAGEHARPIDIYMHAETVHAMRRYLGVAGVLVRAIEQARRWIVGYGVPPFGTNAWRAWYELRKLPRIIDQRLEALRTGALDPRAHAELLDDIANLSRQVDRHKATLDAMDLSPGVGYIAAEGHAPPRPLPDRPIPRERRADPRIERYPAEHSPLMEKYPTGSFWQVGPSWKEEGRTYRVVEVRDRDGKVLAVREEIRSLDSRGRELDHWVQRGSEANTSGVIGEGASARMVADEIERGVRPREIMLDPELVKRGGGGQGFDGVVVRFDGKGNATIILIEVKNYPGRYVPLADITAINDNLIDNLKDLAKRLDDPKVAKEMGLTPAQAKQAGEAINQMRLEVEVHVGSDTRLGGVEVEGGGQVSKLTDRSVLTQLAAEIRAQLGGRDIPVTAKRIEERFMAEAKVQVSRRDRIGTTSEFHQLAMGKATTLTAEGTRRAQAALLAERTAPSIVEKPLRVGRDPGTFVDGNNNHFVVLSPERGTPGAKLGAEAALRLRETRTRPASATEPTRVILDVTNLSAAERRALRRHLEAVAKKPPRLDLDRIHIIDVRTGAVSAFASLPQ
jgi:hypothetical protein